MFINGSKEWIGKEAHTFLSLRMTLENKLKNLDFDYFYGGIISKRSVYDEHLHMLGAHFPQVFVDFDFKETPYIMSPEYTFRVYDYLKRTDALSGGSKTFYSQEMIRNEHLEDIENGKTFSFWQIGYEIFGQDDAALSMDSIGTLHHCLQALPIDNYYYRVTDKRIFKALCQQHNIENMLEVSLLLDACNEDSETFYKRFIELGGSVAFADKLRELMELSKEGRLTFDILRKTIDHPVAVTAIDNLNRLWDTFSQLCGEQALVLVPYMPKTWDAYTTIIYDARLPGYDKAIAGGGNLFIDPSNPHCTHSGAGIGVTRIAEYLNNNF